jgi:hypothetical protein
MLTISANYAFRRKVKVIQDFATNGQVVVVRGFYWGGT